MMPDHVWAMSGSTPIWLLILIGKDTHDGSYQRIIPVSGGLGANARGDGEVCTFPANLSSTSIEVLEATTPVLCERKELLTDSAGAGRFRGGPGVRFAVRTIERTAYSLAFSRVMHPPAGILGGGSGSGGRVLLNGQILEPGAEGVVEAGSLLVLETPGGGGIGNAEERAPERVDRDLQDGLISRRHALEVYKHREG